MENVKTIAAIKRNIENHIGEKVTLKANGGRKKILVNNGVIESAHPSPFSARYGFFGSKPFSKINNYLKSIEKEEINW